MIVTSFRILTEISNRPSLHQRQLFYGVFTLNYVSNYMRHSFLYMSHGISLYKFAINVYSTNNKIEKKTVCSPGIPKSL